LNSYQITKIKNKKLKTCSGWWPFQCLSNGTTLMKIKSGQTVPLSAAPSFLFYYDYTTPGKDKKIYKILISGFKLDKTVWGLYKYITLSKQNLCIR
jgi:hypothetical protein